MSVEVIGFAGFLLQKKPALTLAHLAARGKSYTSLLAREVNTTFAHGNHIFSILQNHRLVELTGHSGDKRIKCAVLTGEGQIVAEKIIDLIVFAENRGQRKAGEQKKVLLPQDISFRINGLIRELNNIEVQSDTVNVPLYRVGSLRWTIAKLDCAQGDVTRRLLAEVDERIAHHLHRFEKKDGSERWS